MHYSINMFIYPVVSPIATYFIMYNLYNLQLKIIKLKVPTAFQRIKLSFKPTLSHTQLKHESIVLHTNNCTANKNAEFDLWTRKNKH